MAGDFLDPIQTPTFRAMFVHAFTPKINKKAVARAAAQGSTPPKPKFTVVCMFPPGTDLGPLQAMAREAGILKWGSEAAVQAKMLNPLFGRPFKKNEEFTVLNDKVNPPILEVRQGFIPGGFAIEAWSYTAPGVVGEVIDPSTGKLLRLTNPEEFFSGCWARATVRAYGYDNEKAGIAFELQNLQRVRKDEKLGGSGGRRDADAEFQPIAAPAGATGATMPNGAGSLFGMGAAPAPAKLDFM